MWNISLTMMQCNHSVALKSFFHQVVWNEPVKLALIGSGCSVATEPTADISHFYNITQVLFTVRNTLLASSWSIALPQLLCTMYIRMWIAIGSLCNPQN